MDSDAAGERARWERLTDLFEAALDLPESEQAAWLARQAPDDPELQATVRRMLAADRSGDDLLAGGVAPGAHLGLEQEARLEPGERVGAFDVLGELGRGGMGIVYAAIDRHLGRPAALKFLPPRWYGVEAAAERLIAEARAASALDHPNVAPVYQIGETEDGRRFIAMPRYDGETLRERLRRGSLPHAEALRIAREVAAGLAAAHRAGIIHRDVSPANIFLTREGPVKLLDFGIAALVGSGGAAGAAGTVSCMSPEQARGEATDARTDVWALGAVLFRMLTGEVLFPGMDAEQVLARLRAEQPLPRLLGRRDVPRALARVVDRALRRDPGQRYPDAGAMLSALAAAAHRPRRFRTAAGSALAMLLVATVAGRDVIEGRRAGAPARTVVAVGALAGPAAAGLSASLVSRLSALPELEVVSAERMAEVRAQLAAAGLAGNDQRAAREAGAQVLIHGEVERTTDGGLALLLRRTDVASARGRQLRRLVARDERALLDSAAHAVAASLDVAPAFAGAVPASLLADRLYEEGLRAHHAGEDASAARLLEGALVEDPQHARALLLLWQVQRALRGAEADTLLARLLAIAEHQPRSERLQLRALWADATLDPSLPALADTLVRERPNDPEGRLLRARALLRAGQPSAAIPELRAVLRLDSLSLHEDPPLCRACTALQLLVAAYDDLDSLDAALELAQRWVRHRPTSPYAWSQLGYVLEDMGRDSTAHHAFRRAAALAPALPASMVTPGRSALRRGNWAEADRLLRDAVENGHPPARRAARWFLAISLREQGRLREALEVERTRLRTAEGSVPPSLFQGQLLTELGRYDEAVAHFDELQRSKLSIPQQGRSARERSWSLTQLATALATAGDTAQLAVLVDTLAAVGSGSSFERDRVAHHYARGLLLRARGALPAAAASFRRALTSPANGYSRVNYQLAGVRLELGDAQGAIDLLEPLLPGVLEATHLYVSRAEIHALLGRAWAVAGEPDRASLHLRWALAAWRHADPELRPRVREAARALADVERSRR